MRRALNFVVFILLLLCGYTTAAFSRTALTAEGVKLWWNEPVEPTSEFLIIWYRPDGRSIDGYEFLDRTQRSYEVTRLRNCTLYEFTLLGFDWSYEQSTYATTKINTGKCAYSSRSWRH
ncbi:unnamed protein product [Dicrocoelium dendriticum]|nr:unnamed protein product [Dicrocoelium dendriticum]